MNLFKFNRIDCILFTFLFKFLCNYLKIIKYNFRIMSIFERELKMVLLGGAGVGKTSIIQAYLT